MSFISFINVGIIKIINTITAINPQRKSQEQKIFENYILSIKRRNKYETER